MTSLRALADEGATYTQQPITIERADADGEMMEICQRPWIGCLDGLAEQDDPIQFGTFGYYADWIGDDWLD